MNVPIEPPEPPKLRPDPDLTSPHRLEALVATGLMDAPPDPGFDRLVRLVGRILEAPVALVSLVDDRRQFFKAAVGLPEPWATRRETALSHSFCRHVVATGAPLIVTDARTDPRVSSNSAIGDLGVISYLGTPLFTREGEILGSFCVIDGKPRTWTDSELSLLADVAESVMSEIELRRENLLLREAKRRLSIQHGVAAALAEASTLDQAIPLVLRAIGEPMDLQVGEFWKFEPCIDRLSLFKNVWLSSEELAPFAMASRGLMLEHGQDMPGQVWATGRPDWFEANHESSHVSRHSLITAAGLGGAFGFPVPADDGVLGVFLFFGPNLPPRNDEVVKVLNVIAAQVGQFAERRRVEDALRTSEGQTRAILESALDCIITINHEGRVLEFNPAAERTFDYSRDEVLGRSMGELIVPPALRESHERGLQRYIATGYGPVLGRRIEIEAMRSDGSIFPVELALTVVRRDGQPPIFTAYLRDITQRRQAEQELQAAKEAAEAANRSKSDFLANMSHEVRTPMSAVVGLADMLLDPSLAAPERDRALQGIRRNGAHLLQLIDDILDLSKIEAGKMDFERVLYSPWRLVLEVESLMRGRASERGVELVREHIGRVPSVFPVDPMRIRQVLVNFVSNAIKFTEPGHRVTIRLRADTTDSDGSPLVRFQVEDQGIGMTAAQLGQIFRPFHQADTTTTRRYGGTGLGLSISKRIAEALGGRITVRSKPGEGSCFTAAFPALLEAADQPWEDISPQESINLAESDHCPLTQLLRARVLLAEDSHDIQRVVCHYLARFGLEVDVADNGRIAVRLATEHPYDLILMDMQMPELDGYGATSSLRRAGYTGPIVALTAHAMREDRDRCLRAGCTDYLAKPVDPTTLHRMLATYIKAPPPTEPAPTQPDDSHSDAAFQSLLRDYANRLPERIEEMRVALDRGDLSSLRDLAHKTRGVAGGYGFPELGEIAGLIEDAIAEGREIELISELVSEFDESVRQIAR